MQTQPTIPDTEDRIWLSPEEVRSLFLKGVWRFAKQPPEKLNKGHKGKFTPVTKVPEANFEGLDGYQRKALRDKIRYAKKKFKQA